MMVGYVHDSTTHWRILDPSLRVVRSQSEVIFDEERNSLASCLHGDETDIFEPPEPTDYVEEIETRRDGLLYDHAGTSHTGEGHGRGDHNCTHHDTNHHSPDDRRSLPAHTVVSSRSPDDENAPLVSRETVVHNGHLHPHNDTARQMAPMTKQSSQPPLTNRITRSQVTISPNALIIMAKALASTSINSDPFTYSEAMDSPQPDHWKREMEEECTSILLNDTFTTINSPEARQL